MLLSLLRDDYNNLGTSNVPRPGSWTSSMSRSEVTGKVRSGAIIEPRMVAANTVSSTGSEVKSYVPVIAVTELRNKYISLLRIVHTVYMQFSCYFENIQRYDKYDMAIKSLIINLLLTKRQSIKCVAKE